MCLGDEEAFFVRAAPGHQPSGPHGLASQGSTGLGVGVSAHPTLLRALGQAASTLWSLLLWSRRRGDKAREALASLWKCRMGCVALALFLASLCSSPPPPPSVKWGWGLLKGFTEGIPAKCKGQGPACADRRCLLWGGLDVGGPRFLLYKAGDVTPPPQGPLEGAAGCPVHGCILRARRSAWHVVGAQ